MTFMEWCLTSYQQPLNHSVHSIGSVFTAKTSHFGFPRSVWASSCRWPAMFPLLLPFDHSCIYLLHTYTKSSPKFNDCLLRLDGSCTKCRLWLVCSLDKSPTLHEMTCIHKWLIESAHLTCGPEVFSPTSQKDFPWNWNGFKIRGIPTCLTHWAWLCQKLLFFELKTTKRYLRTQNPTQLL